MSKARLCLLAMFISFFSIHSYAQTAAKPAQQGPGAKVRQEPCWQQAGISQSAKEQRDAIANERRSQVEAACADTSLNAQQKKAKIQQIREDAKQKIQALVTPEQEQQLQACQKERAGGHPAMPAVHHAGAGPCGEMPGSAGSGGGSSEH